MSWSDIVVKNLAEILWVMLAAFGGVARGLDSYMRTGTFPGLGIFIAGIVVSGFSGYMTASVVILITPDWALVGAGIGGYVGTQALDFVLALFRKKFDLKS
jgi:hypothetical protein